MTDVPGIFMFETTFQGNHYAQGAAISKVMLFMVALGNDITIWLYKW